MRPDIKAVEKMTTRTAPTQRRVEARTHGPLVWQRTATVGTELVLRDGTAPGVVTGSVVVGGQQPYTSRWHADLDGAWRVRALTITTEGSGWRRNLALSRAGHGPWTCGAEESGGIDAPAAGIDDPSRLDGGAVLLLADSPIFLTWAMRTLRLGAESGPARVPVIRVLMPWLTVVTGDASFHRVSDTKLRVAGDGPAVAYDLDAEGIVTYQPGRLRIAH
ncbi:putative glycolipid-binding domain-containing protein [Actinoplanes sp. KI2]|uniref:putative glycolipid-binding domain-containing protein n=1 Tax=Actinoplanes sp. KI2 TaxID=2983315 RepID=UPI0021D5C586|nr:putative glycolipid-binding domain-containing protein [Actinoplanes sp. KI2]MCU7727678.1 putative glycolipid-binding domain-containing protein [Actinoplanes sp. KI2]